MSELPNCPSCGSMHTYEDKTLMVCPICAHEWSISEQPEEEVIKDAYGCVLTSGDQVTVIKDLKIKGSSLVVKVGTKVKNITLLDGDHDIGCKISGMGSVQLKSKFVKKIT